MLLTRKLLLTAALLLSISAQAQEAAKIRLGTLAPRGTSWHRSLLEMGEKWRAAQGRASVADGPVDERGTETALDRARAGSVS